MRPQIVKKTALLFIHFFVCAIALGQQDPPPPQRSQNPPPFPELPLDSNIFFLLIAVLLIGVMSLLFKKGKATN